MARAPCLPGTERARRGPHSLATRCKQKQPFCSHTPAEAHTQTHTRAPAPATADPTALDLTATSFLFVVAARVAESGTVRGVCHGAHSRPLHYLNDH